MREEEDLIIGLQEFVVGYSKAPEQPQSSARPICHSHAMTRTRTSHHTQCCIGANPSLSSSTPFLLTRQLRSNKFLLSPAHSHSVPITSLLSLKLVFPLPPQ